MMKHIFLVLLVLLTACTSNSNENVDIDNLSKEMVELDNELINENVLSDTNATEETTEKEINDPKPEYSLETLKEKLKSEGYEIEQLQEYSIVSRTSSDYERKFRPAVIRGLNEKNINYDFLCTVKLCDYIAIDNVIIKFNDDWWVEDIFVIKKGGKNLNPRNIKLLIDEIDKESEQRALEEKKEAEEFLEKYRKEEEQRTIRIGMTADEVLERWGEPKDINRTITANTIYEQWIYPGSRYLYFENGVLVTIQQY